MCSSPILITRTVAIGPLKGMLEIDNAAEDPIAANTSASFSLSNDNTLATICVSNKNVSGNSGRIGRSIKRADKISFSLGLASRLIKPPGILPAE